MIHDADYRAAQDALNRELSARLAAIPTRFVINDRFDVDAEFSVARKRVAQAIDRVVHFQARSEGQKRRHARARIGTYAALLTKAIRDGSYPQSNPEGK